MYIELHGEDEADTTPIGEGTFITIDDHGEIQIAIFTQVSPGVYKWVNLDGNRQNDKEWSRNDVLNGVVDMPNEDEWRILDEYHSFTVHVD